MREVLSRLVLSQDSKGSQSAKTTKLTADNKALQQQVDKLGGKRKALEAEVLSLQNKVKKVETEMIQKKKSYNTKLTEFEAEKSTWETKFKQFDNELRRKDQTINKYCEIIQGGVPKDATVANSVEIVGELPKPGTKFYGSGEVCIC